MLLEPSKGRVICIHTRHTYKNTYIDRGPYMYIYIVNDRMMSGYPITMAVYKLKEKQQANNYSMEMK